MGAKSNIEWTDATWNPVTGCTKVSAGCKHCYAETIAERFRGHAAFPAGFDVQLRPHRLEDPVRWQRPRRIFVCSMSDLFHRDIPTSYRDRVFDVMERAPHHVFQVLTKRSATMRMYLAGRYGRNGAMPSHIWCGVSVENSELAVMQRIVDLQHCRQAYTLFLSMEPLIGPVNARHMQLADWLRGIRWVIVGGESGPKARPMDAEWAREIRNECRNQGIAFFMKQMARREPIPQDLMIREYP